MSPPARTWPRIGAELGACTACLRRGWLIGELAGHLEAERGRIAEVLGLGEDELIEGVGGRRRDAIHRALEAFDAAQSRAALGRAGLSAICRCHPDYPASLAELASAPALLYIAGAPEVLSTVAEREPVAIVGARRASTYGVEVARSLARSLSAAGVPVISGLALGIDSAAHAGALAGGGLTAAVLPAGADRPYPRVNRALYRRITADGVAVSELPPGVGARRWMFPARNRVIAALARMTVVVEAGPGSGSLVTAACARELGRAVGAVPGRITSPQAEGCLSLLAEGAGIIRGAQDVLDALYAGHAPPVTADPRPALDQGQRALLQAVASEPDPARALARAGVESAPGLAALAWLELCGYLRRELGGRFVVIP